MFGLQPPRHISTLPRATKLKVSTMSPLSALKAEMRADMHQLRLRATLRRSIDDSLIELVPKNSRHGDPRSIRPPTSFDKRVLKTRMN